VPAGNRFTVALTFKESDRHWEEGEYQPIRLQGYPVQAPRESNSRTVEQSEKLAKVPISVSLFDQHTLEEICRKEPVRVPKLAKCL
jgi:hypothetical protein